MTPDEIQRAIHDLRARVDDLEDEREAIKRLPTAVAELKGMVEVIQGLVLGGNQRIDQATSFKTAITFAAVIVVPVIVALIGGYFALRAGTR